MSRPPSVTDVRQATRPKGAPDSAPLPQCECGRDVEVRFERGPYVCWACYEQRRQLNSFERRILAEREAVPARHPGEGTTAYWHRALSLSRPAKPKPRGDDDAKHEREGL